MTLPAVDRKRIVVAMSGGVDSSYAAALLAGEGHEVIGMTLRLWTPSPWNDGERFGGCCSPRDVLGAKQVCRDLGVPHYTYDLEEKFKEKVVDNFVSEYLEGRTPNPCVRCNGFIKFDVLFRYALALGADFMATGHYARVQPPQAGDADGYALLKAADAAKDQSYFLYMLGQRQLSRLLFPLGGLSKPEVRARARSCGLATADKEDSQDVCFLEGRSPRDFLRERAGAAVRKGPIVATDGRVLGEHEGLPYYTIGQRERLGVAAGRRLYVVAKDAAANALVVGTGEENLGERCRLQSVSWTSAAAPGRLRASVKIRYRHPGAEAWIEPLPEGSAEVRFSQPQSALSAGQSAVFYDADRVLGGGVIVGR